MKRACRLTIPLSTLLCASAFAMTAPGDTEALGVAPSATEWQIAIAGFDAGPCSQATIEDGPGTHEGDPTDGISVACEDISIEQRPVDTTIVTPRPDDGRSTDDPIRPGYMPDGAPIYRLRAHGRHQTRSPCNVSVPLPTGARARLTC